MARDVRLLVVAAMLGAACGDLQRVDLPEQAGDEAELDPVAPPTRCRQLGCTATDGDQTRIPSCTDLIARLIPRPDLGSCSVRFPADVHFATGGAARPDPDHENYLIVEDLFEFPDTHRIGVVIWRDGFARCIFDDCAW